MKVIKLLSVVMSLTVLTLVGAPEVWAQDTLVGKYAGNFDTQRPTGKIESRGMDLTITNIENERVKGSVTMYAGGICSGAIPVEGTYKENQLLLRGKGGGAAGDCNVSFKLVSEGNKLTGTNGLGRRVELSK
jgi:hypothetical protein